MCTGAKIASNIKGVMAAARAPANMAAFYARLRGDKAPWRGGDYLAAGEDQGFGEAATLLHKPRPVININMVEH